MKKCGKCHLKFPPGVLKHIGNPSFVTKRELVFQLRPPCWHRRVVGDVVMATTPTWWCLQRKYVDLQMSSGDVWMIFDLGVPGHSPGSQVEWPGRMNRIVLLSKTSICWADYCKEMTCLHSGETYICFWPAVAKTYDHIVLKFCLPIDSKVDL